MDNMEDSVIYQLKRRDNLVRQTYGSGADQLPSSLSLVCIFCNTHSICCFLWPGESRGCARDCVRVSLVFLVASVYLYLPLSLADHRIGRYLFRFHSFLFDCRLDVSAWEHNVDMNVNKLSNNAPYWKREKKTMHSIHKHIVWLVFRCFRFGFAANKSDKDSMSRERVIYRGRIWLAR